MDSPKRERQRRNAKAGGSPAIDAQKRVSPTADIKAGRSTSDGGRVTIYPNGGISVG